MGDYLEAVGDTEGATQLRETGIRGQAFGRLLGKARSHTSHVVGFAAERGAGEQSASRVQIWSGFEAEADLSFIGTQIKVTSEVFRVHDIAA